MPVVWTIESHGTRGAKRSLTLKRVVDGNESTAQRISSDFHINDTKLQIKAKFKEMFNDRKAERSALNSVIQDSDLSAFETEVNS